MAEDIPWFPTEKNVEDYDLLRSMLKALRIEFDQLSKKKADGQLNKMKIKMVNKVLEPLKELFKQEDSHKFLESLNEDDIPSYSDVVLIISQYETAIFEFKKRYYTKDEYLTDEFGRNEQRWMTEEFPPNYNAPKSKKKKKVNEIF